MEFKIYSLYGAVFGAQRLAAERKILTRRKILAVRGILKFKVAGEQGARPRILSPLNLSGQRLHRRPRNCISPASQRFRSQTPRHLAPRRNLAHLRCRP